MQDVKYYPSEKPVSCVRQLKATRRGFNKLGICIPRKSMNEANAATSSGKSSLSSSYETKRKTQNREAQRRYRQRLKRSQENVSVQTSPPLFTIGGPPSFVDAIDQSHLNQADLLEPLHVPGGPPSHIHRASTDTFDSWHHGNGGQSDTLCPSEVNSLSESSLQQLSGSLPSSSLATMDFELKHARWVPVSPPSSSNASNIQGRRCSLPGTKQNAEIKTVPGYRRPSHSYTTTNTKSTSHEKIVAKASNMIEELQKLYEFGVDIDLLENDDEISNCLQSLDALFQRSSQAAMAHSLDAAD